MIFESTGVLLVEYFFLSLKNRLESLLVLPDAPSVPLGCGPDWRRRVRCSVTFSVKSFIMPGPPLSRARARSIGIQAAMIEIAVSATERMTS